MDWMDWVERFGGWGVVILIVRWMMTRIDRMIDNFELALKKFDQHETEELVYRAHAKHDFADLKDDHKEIIDILGEMKETT